MTLERARLLKAPVSGHAPTALPDTEPTPIAAAGYGRRVAREVLDARAEAERIVADANARAARILADARESAEAVAAAAAREAREAETAKLAASFLALRREDERRAERDLDRAIELAVVLAERLIGEGLAIEPARIAHLAAAALAETRGARRVRIDASPEDAEALQRVLAELGEGRVEEVIADPSLRRGSLVVHTDLGRVDARLEPQLERLSRALREALE